MSSIRTQNLIRSRKFNINNRNSLNRLTAIAIYNVRHLLIFTEMNILKKLFIPSGQQQELTAYESWSVRWRSRYGQYNGDTQDEMEIFTTKEDAEKFATELRNAFKLIKHTSGTRVEVSKN